MLQIFELQPGVTLRYFHSSRFKQGCLTFQLVRPMSKKESAMNALLPAVLLRGTKKHRDLLSITCRLDELYGASVGTLVRRVGDYQTTGLACGFIEDQFCMGGDTVFAPMTDFLREVLLEPVSTADSFDPEFVSGEKKNLISTIESELNDKRAYAMAQLFKAMCRDDSYGIPRLGEKEDAEAIDARVLYAHYQKILRESPVEIFYVGSAPAEEVIRLLRPLLTAIPRDYRPLPPQTSFHDAGGGSITQEMELSQGKLCLGYVTPVTNRDPGFAAMQVMNTLFGAGMTSKLFMNVREKLSLCYAIGSGYSGSKGIVTVSAGIDSRQEAQVLDEIARQLDAIRAEDITPAELTAAKEALCASLRGVHDSSGSIENYYATAALSGLAMTPEQYRQAVEAVTVPQAAQAARELRLHTTYFLKGVSA